eukprot:5715984-Amphidinium_carterae.1
MELASLGKGSPSPLFKVSMPALGHPLATLDGLQGFRHTFAVTDDPAGLAFFQSSRNGQEFSSKDRLPTARKGHPGSFASVSDIAYPTSPEVWVAAVSARSVGPDSVHSRLHDQSKLMGTEGPRKNKEKRGSDT